MTYKITGAASAGLISTMRETFREAIQQAIVYRDMGSTTYTITTWTRTK